MVDEEIRITALEHDDTQRIVGFHPAHQLLELENGVRVLEVDRGIAEGHSPVARSHVGDGELGQCVCHEEASLRGARALLGTSKVRSRAARPASTPSAGSVSTLLLLLSAVLGGCDLGDLSACGVDEFCIGIRVACRPQPPSIASVSRTHVRSVSEGSLAARLTSSVN